AAVLALTAGWRPAVAADDGLKFGGAQQTAEVTPSSASSQSDPALAATLAEQQKMLQEQARQIQEQSEMLAKQQEMLRQQQQQINALQQQSAPGIKPATLTVPRVGSGWYYPAEEVVPVP